MENNFISSTMNTHFYVDITNKTYGVCINEKDADKFDEIINTSKTKCKNLIDSWTEEWGVANV